MSAETAIWVDNDEAAEFSISSKNVPKTIFAPRTNREDWLSGKTSEETEYWQIHNNVAYRVGPAPNHAENALKANPSILRGSVLGRDGEIVRCAVSRDNGPEIEIELHREIFPEEPTYGYDFLLDMETVDGVLQPRVRQAPKVKGNRESDKLIDSLLKDF